MLTIPAKQNVKHSVANFVQRKVHMFQYLASNSVKKWMLRRIIKIRQMMILYKHVHRLSNDLCSGDFLGDYTTV